MSFTASDPSFREDQKVVKKMHAVNAVLWTGNTSMLLKCSKGLGDCHTFFCFFPDDLHLMGWNVKEDYLIPFVCRGG